MSATSNLRLALWAGSETSAIVTALRRIPDVTLTAIVACDGSSTNGIDTWRSQGVAVQTPDDLLRTPTTPFDALLIADEQAEVASLHRAVDQGKHLLLVTPGEWPVAELEELRSLGEKRGARILVCEPSRHRPSVQAVREAVMSGKLGTIGLMRLHDWSHAHMGQAASVWEALRANIDLACWLFGEIPESLYCVSSQSLEDEATVGPVGPLQIQLGFRAGGMAILDCYRSLPSAEDYFSLSVLGSTGATYADDHHNRQLLLGSAGARGVTTGEGVLPMVSRLRNLLDACAGRVAALTTWEDLRRSAIVLAGARLSSESSAAVRLAHPEDHYVLA
ncbi:MAG: Gfo/Idh/MocA family oxidoreductase [Planctomycetota bacterium]|nr:Gfo/Idh/MocA family oxidoreductase [Planctomycetota bacterium]